ncbi:hypothetical protein D910_05406 [Dendroctonus ponderosae]|uniref:HAT C-terminal dimerisation domain-containing protein n=1 Tax=Dendroctonus ponderosae TaxID=77166 RepID=U4U4M5_DENPD|nr:hypothetical protein D910_05406 [Dendroctonus ponderosae]
MRSDAVDSNVDNMEPRLTGAALAKIVENLCLKFNIDLSWCVGIGTYSCSVMASNTKGEVQELSKKAVNAQRCPCSNHVLNSTLATSLFQCKISGDNLVKICNAPQKISIWQDHKTANDAHCLLQTLRSSDFIVSSICLSDVLGNIYIHILFLIHTNVEYKLIDLKRATDAITDTMSILRTKREKVDPVFRQLFEEAREVVEQLDVDIRCPRIVSRQTHRANNQPAQLAEEYFRIAVYIPLLDSVINDLEDRLSPDVLNLFQLGVFIPKVDCANEDEYIETVKKLANDHKLLIDNTPVSIIIIEYRLWRVKWKRIGNIPQSISNLIENCDADIYPNVRKFLCILASLPVSVATAERSFSTLRKLKTRLMPGF